MIYKNIHKAEFISRPNRFIAEIKIDGCIQLAHVKNTGRCRELLIPGSEIFVEKSEDSKRKTKYDLISVYKNKTLINIDSQAPNKIFSELLGKGEFLKNIRVVRQEVMFENSRLDFYIEAGDKKIFAEVKGVTLEQDGVAMFPDAPTERGLKHINSLIKCRQMGFQSYIVFIIQMDGIKYFTPNYKTHREFGESLKSAEKSGVEIFAFNCCVKKDEIFAVNQTEVIF